MSTATNSVPKFEPQRASSDESFEKQCTDARRKIYVKTFATYGKVSAAIPSSVRDDVNLEMMLDVRTYGDFVFALRWSPNSVDKTGFQGQFAYCAPLFDRPFSRTGLLSGVVGIELNKLGALITQPTLSHFASAANRVRERMLDDQLLSSSDIGFNETNYVGFFATNAGMLGRGSGGFWISTQAHSSSLSARAFDLICSAQPASYEVMSTYERAIIERQNKIMQEKHDLHYKGGTIHTLQRSSSSGTQPIKCGYQSMHAVLFEQKEFGALRLQQRKHRATLLARAIHAAGLMRSDRQSTIEEIANAIAINDARVDLLVNDFEQMEKTNKTSDIVYLDNLTSIFSIASSGVLVRSPGELAHISGPWNVNAVDRSGDYPFIGVALSTNSMLSNKSAPEYKGQLAEKSPMLPSEHTFWREPDGVRRANAIFNEQISRKRTEEWKKWEKTCGSTGVEQTLYDVCVRQADPQFNSQFSFARPEDVWK